MVGEQIWHENDNNHYSYEKVEEGLKSYTVGEEVASDKFGNKPAKMITEKSGTDGNDRFYVMALEDFDYYGQHYWYYNAGSLDKIEKNTDIAFGADEPIGKTNTKEMLQKYKEKKYGEPKIGGYYTDLWGLKSLEEKVEKGWFVPSRAEWSAFGDMLFSGGVFTTFDRINYRLQERYWSSSQGGESLAWYIDLFNGYMGAYMVSDYYYVRLSTTF